MQIDAVLTPAEIDHLPEADLTRTLCVVFDVLRATSSILTGLASGVREIRPVATLEEAREWHTQWPGALLGGERQGDRIPGFDLGNSPLEYRRTDVCQIITTTTNGTVALRACAAAKEVWAGALLNLQALEDGLRETAPERVLLVCSGTFRELALEDVLAAGMLAAAFPEAELTDAARTARAVYLEHRGDIGGALRLAKNGRSLQHQGRENDVEWCSQISLFPVIGQMQNGILRAR
jgi:2-phosphosulfolactate phosphatase